MVLINLNGGKYGLVVRLSLPSLSQQVKYTCPNKYVWSNAHNIWDIQELWESQYEKNELKVTCESSASWTISSLPEEAKCSAGI